jgi:hypothetical protein
MLSTGWATIGKHMCLYWIRIFKNLFIEHTQSNQVQFVVLRELSLFKYIYKGQDILKGEIITKTRKKKGLSN